LNVIAKITFGGVLHLRTPKGKRGYKGPLFKAYPGDLLISKIRVAQGSLCLVPNDLDYLAVSPEYPVYAVDHDKVRGEFLALAIRSAAFKSRVSRLRSGNTTKARIRPSDFEDLEFPVPSLPEQDALVSEYQTALSEAGSKEQEADATERAGWQAFESALGVAPSLPLPDRPVFIASFTDLDRWSHEGILDTIMRANAPEKNGGVPEMPLGEVIADLSNGWSPKCLDRAAKPEEWGVLKVGAVSFGEYNEAENKALPSHFKPKSELEVQNGDVLISRANVMRLVGACAIVRETRPRLMLCDKIFRVLFRAHSQIDAEFLSEVMKLSVVRQQIEAKVTGTSPTMKNISKPSLMGLRFPVPQGPDGVEVQRSLVAAVKGVRETAKSLRKEAQKLRIAAWEKFESALFETAEP
jgi:type I restriction enzyme S subunit